MTYTYDDFKEQSKIMGFSEMVVPASYTPIFRIVFEGSPRLGTTALESKLDWLTSEKQDFLGFWISKGFIAS